jgi:hypothetical protein
LSIVRGGRAVNVGVKVGDRDADAAADSHRREVAAGEHPVHGALIDGQGLSGGLDGD